jgi:hypothetical protein
MGDSKNPSKMFQQSSTDHHSYVFDIPTMRMLLLVISFCVVKQKMTSFT